MAEPTVSKVSERLVWLQGKKVIVRLAYAEVGQMGGETFTAIYKDVVPLGREYFFVLSVANAHRLVRASSVVEVLEVTE